MYYLLFLYLLLLFRPPQNLLVTSAPFDLMHVRSTVYMYCMIGKNALLTYMIKWYWYKLNDIDIKCASQPNQVTASEAASPPYTLAAEKAEGRNGQVNGEKDEEILLRVSILPERPSNINEK